MLNNLKEHIKKVHWIVWLSIIILFAVLRLILLFGQRDGHHVDETWSYGFANSFYSPHVYGGMGAGNHDNIGVWTTGEVFLDYLSVSESQRFSFNSVMFNVGADFSPPLYVLVLHFICSLFPGTFSWGFAFFISLLAYIPTLVFVYLISFEFTDSRVCGFISLCYYIFSGCGTSNFLYLRVYHLFTMFTLALYWIILKVLKEKDNNKIFYCFLPIVTILGSMTHYYFLVIAFFITFFSVLYLLIKKRWRDFFITGFTMLFSVVVFFALFWDAFSLLFQPSTVDGSVLGGYSYPYLWDLSVANKHMFSGSIGFYIGFNGPDIIEFLGLTVIILSVLSLICFLFRNEKWMKIICNHVKDNVVLFGHVTIKFLAGFDVSIWIAILTSISSMLIIPISAELYTMGYVERYFFPIMAMVSISYSSLISYALVELGKKKFSTFTHIIFSVMISALLLICCITSSRFTWPFKFAEMGEKRFASEIDGKDCYVFVSQLRDLIWLSPILCNARNIYIDYSKEGLSDEEVLRCLDQECLLLIESNDFLTIEQKSEYISQGAFSLGRQYVPVLLDTEDEFVDRIEGLNGHNYFEIDSYSTFIGDLHLYKCE